MRAADTNVLVRILARDDPKQARIADEFIAQGAWVSLLALAEAVWVLSAVYRRNPAEIASSVHMLLNHRSLVLQDADAVSEALNAFHQHPSLGFTDCLLLEIARKAGNLPLGTFDRNLAKLDGAHKL